MRWFIRNDSVLNTTREKTTNTVSVITSWITFNSINENGPSLPWKPILLAGTWKQYSKKAIAQLINIMAKRPKDSTHFNSLNFRWPYQANVIKELESTNSPIVYKLFIIWFIKINGSKKQHMVTGCNRFRIVLTPLNATLRAQNYSIMNSKNNLNSCSASVFVIFKW